MVGVRVKIFHTANVIDEDINAPYYIDNPISSNGGNGNSGGGNTGTIPSWVQGELAIEMSNFELKLFDVVDGGDELGFIFNEISGKSVTWDWDIIQEHGGGVILQPPITPQPSEVAIPLYEDLSIYFAIRGTAYATIDGYLVSKTINYRSE